MSGPTIRERIEALRPWPEGEPLIRALLAYEETVVRSAMPTPNLDAMREAERTIRAARRGCDVVGCPFMAEEGGSLCTPHRIDDESGMGTSDMLPQQTHSAEYNRGWADGNASALDACNPVIAALTAERDALVEDEHAAAQEADRLRDAAQEYFEATLPLLNDYPLTDDERRIAWQRLRETNRALRAALHREDGA